MFQTPKFKKLKTVANWWFLLNLPAHAPKNLDICNVATFLKILFKIKTMFQTEENNPQNLKSIGFPASLCKNFSKGP